MKGKPRKKKPTEGAGFTAEVFRECVRNLSEVSLMQPEERPALPPGWEWTITHPGGDLGNPKLGAQLLTQDVDCFVSIAPDLAPGLFSLSITTGVAPAEVVAAVLKANRIL